VNGSEATELLDKAEQLTEEGLFDDGLALVHSLYGAPLPSSLRGRSLAIEVVCLEGNHQIDDAENLIVDNMKEEGGDLAYVLAAGQQFSELEAFHYGEVFLRNLCDLDSQNAMAWYNLAVCLGRAARYQEALEIYDEALNRDPAFAQAYEQKAFCLAAVGDVPGAIQAYHSYFAFEPNDHETWIQVAELERESGNRAGAYEAFEKALGAGADKEEVLYNFVLAAKYFRDTDELERRVLELEALDDESWRALLARAELEQLNGDVWSAWEAVTEACAVVTEDDEDDDVFEYVLCMLLAFARRHDMGIHADEYVEQVFEREFFTEHVLNELRLLAGRFSNAVRSYQVALAHVSDALSPARYRICGVSAESSESAADLAREFQRRCGREEWDVVSIHCLSDPDEGLIGVYWQSPVLDALPGQGNPAPREGVQRESDCHGRQ